METKHLAHAALIGSFCLLTACAGYVAPRHWTYTLSMETIRSADYGTYPKNYKQEIRHSLSRDLLDADSAKIGTITRPKKVLDLYTVSEKGKYQLYRKSFYAMCVEINAKNAYGGYTGWQWQMYMFDGSIMKKLSGVDVDPEMCSSDEIYIDKMGVEEDYVSVKIVP